MDIQKIITRWGPLFLISAMGLFFELAVIRWLSAEVRLFSYFKNFCLFSAFLGFAIGYGLASTKRPSYLATFGILFAVFVLLVVASSAATANREIIYPGTDDVFFWYPSTSSQGLELILFLGVIVVFFLTTMLLFIPLGQATGAEMDQHAPLTAYIVNIIASLVGVWLFTLTSYLQTPPLLWFGLAGLGWLGYLWLRRQPHWASIAMYVGALVGIFIFSPANVTWSPYQRLDLTEATLPRQSTGEAVKVGYNLQVQQVFYQSAFDFSDKFLSELQGDVPHLEKLAVSYNLPYQLRPAGSRVLIVGAGMGNDVAAALRNGAGQVDAVEIDPEILAKGQALHPERPYADPRVTPIVDDARAFLKNTTQQYDLIAFGLLDSHQLLSSLSSVRLDSFVYTIQSFEQVKAHLAPGGVVALTFADSTPWIEERLGRMLAQVFGPDQVYIFHGEVGTTFVAGVLSPETLTTHQLEAWQADPAYENLALATDDWPYLYLKNRAIPSAYWQALLAIGLVCLLLLARSFPEVLKPQWSFWLLGAAFLLIEFKSVTELALLFGTTWLVNSLAITGVLLMVLAANLVVLRIPRIHLEWSYALLFVSLVITYFLPLEWLVSLPVLLRAVVSMVVLSLPLFFAGLIFGESLRRVGSTAGPLASNLSGSVGGGVLEYGSLVLGIKSLYILAALVYVGAWLTSRFQKR